MDYSLSGLSSRFFEQLIQSLGFGLLGSRLTVFGDGPDGGREATFEGLDSYPSAQNPWSGYGVVQAKYKQRVSRTDIDGEWALRQLSDELDKFVGPNSRRRKPEYYIFATNVVLSPGVGGWKDKVLKLLATNEIGLSDFQVWDYDQIRTLLDNNRDVRQSYAAWVTSGDVLSSVLAWINGIQPDFEETLANFLQKEFLADQYANLERAGHPTDEQIPIARVFVDLPVDKEEVRQEPEEPDDLVGGFVHDLVELAAERLDQHSIRLNAPLTGEIGTKAGPVPGRLVLVGGPGQGKSTVGQFVCQLFRASILQGRPQETLSVDVLQALKVLDGQCEAEDILIPGVRRFPIRVVLNEFAAALAKGGTTSVLSYIVDRIAKRVNRAVSVDDFRRWLASYPWIIVLDGLDEVPASSNRDAVIGSIRDFWVDVSSANGDVLVVATTRPQGYGQDFSPALYRHLYLSPLSPERAVHYARRLAAVRYAGDEDRRDTVVERIIRASRDPSVARLMTSPLQVTIMTVLVGQVGQPPRERWRLFHEYYDIIYKREMERDIPSANILRDHKADVDTIHRWVALVLQVEAERSGTTDARLTRDQLASLVEQRLVEEGHESEALINLKTEILNAAAERLVFLVGLEANRVGFEIRSLQEFMVAEALVEGHENLIGKRLRHIAPLANWRNVFLFATGKVFADQQHLRDSLVTICAELDEDLGDRLLPTTLMGSQLALDVLEDGSASRQPRYAKVLFRQALKLLDLPLQAEPHRLARLYEIGVKTIFEEEIVRRLHSDMFSSRLGAWGCLVALADGEVEWAQQLAEQHWPPETDEQWQILHFAVGARSGKWSSEKIIGILPCIDPWQAGGLVHSVDGVSSPSWLQPVSVLLVGARHSSGYELLPSQAGGRREPVRLAVTELTQAHSSLAGLVDMRDPCPGWLPYKAAATFSGQPSRETLAEALEAFAKHADEPIRFRSDRLAWPLGACVAEASSSSQFQEFALWARAGLLGDHDDWVKAESRWRSHGVQSSDVEYLATRTRWPFDANIGKVGFPFSCAEPIAGPNYSAVIEASPLMSLFKAVEDSSMRRLLARLMLGALEDELLWQPGFPLGDLKISPVDVTTLSLVIRSAAPGPTPIYFDLDILNSYDWTSGVDKEWCDLLDFIGTATGLYPTIARMPQFASAVAAALAANPDKVGLLEILSWVCGWAPVSIGLKGILERWSHEPKYEGATLVIRLCGDWGLNLELLAKRSVELLAAGTDFYRRLSYLATRNVAMPHMEAFFLRLQALLGDSHWQASRTIVRALNDALRRRNSQVEVGNRPYAI